MEDRRMWITMVGGSVLVAAAAGGMIWRAQKQIETSEQEVVVLEDKILKSRTLIEGTSGLEKEVIVLRETEEEAKRILPDEEGLNELVHSLRKFEEQAGVHIKSLKAKPEPRNANNTEQFKKVAYTVTLESNAFDMLEFFDRIEDHGRFMSIPVFTMTASPRRKVEETGVAAHKIQLDVETYVYERQNVPDPIKIESYDRKRELLLGEIHRRQQAFAISGYDYRGQRGRRDPWIDPRVPINDSRENALSIEAQLSLVENLIERTSLALEKWEQVSSADNVIVEMTERADLEEMLIALEAELRRIEDENVIRFIPSQRRMQREVLDPLADLRLELKSSESSGGPSREALAELEEAIGSHLARGEFRLALDAYRPIESSLSQAERDDKRKDIVKNLRDLAFIAEVAVDFNGLPMDIGGVAIMEGTESLVLIDGRPYQEGELLSDQLLIRSVRNNEVEFIYRGVVLIRHF